MQPGLANDLQKWADQFGVALQSPEFAAKMDSVDPLREIRTNFTFPTMKDLPCGNIVKLIFVLHSGQITDDSLVDFSYTTELDEECIYLCGNSLGLKPKRADSYQQEVLDCWAKL